MTDLYRLFNVNSGNMLDLALEHWRLPDVVDDWPAYERTRALEADALPHLLTLCPLSGGSSVQVDEALEAEKALNAGGDIRPFQPRRARALRRLGQYNRKPGDDDHPPPSTAYAAVRPKGGGGADLAFRTSWRS